MKLIQLDTVIDAIDDFVNAIADISDTKLDRKIVMLALFALKEQLKAEQESEMYEYCLKRVGRNAK